MTGVLPTLRPIPGISDSSAPIRSRSELRAFFEAGCKPATAARRIGVELELLPLLASGEAAPFLGEGASVESLLLRLAELTGLAPSVVSGHVLGLQGHDRAVHLEPGGQVELALGPRETATEILADLLAWRITTREAAAATGVHLAAIGLQPVTPVRDITWVPKERYPYMRAHLEARGDLAHHMMKATASLQVSLDYRTEAEAGEILATSLAVAPLMNALLVNSPLEEGRAHGLLSRRPVVWSRTDDDRCGLLPWVHDEPWSFDRWIEWTLSVPVMFVMREGRHVPLDGRTFAQYLTASDAPGPATHADYQLHLTTLFPEVRLKQHVEVRGTDSAGPELAAGVAAAWTGLLSESATRVAAGGLVAGLDASAREELHLAVGRSGLAASLGAGTVRDVLPALLDLAARGLAEAERPLLRPLATIVATGRTPAELLLADFELRGAPALLDRS